MKPINKYLNGLFGNLGMAGADVLAQDDVERLSKIYNGSIPKYIADEASLVVKYPFAQPYILFTIYSPLDEANVNSISFVNRNDYLLNRYTFNIHRNVNYPGRLFDKVIFPKNTNIQFACESDFKLDNDVFKGNKFEGKFNIFVSDEGHNGSTLDLSELTESISKLTIINFEHIKFNPKQKVDILTLKMYEIVPHINTLPDCNELIIDTQFLGKKYARMLTKMFDEYELNKKIAKITFEGNLTPLDKLKIMNKINAANK